MREQTKYRQSLVAALIASSCLTMPATAQTAAQAPADQQARAAAQGNLLEEVVVTAARKRSENVQTVPVAVTAINQDMLVAEHVTNLSNIARLAPNLQMSHQVGTDDVVTIYMRGFGTYSNDFAVDPHIATFVDGIYQPALVGTLIDMFDIGQVEVQKGPQGTLLGKNAPIGALYISTAKPTGDFSGEIEGDYGSYDHFGLRARLNVPIIKDADGNAILAGKVSLVEKEGGNWVYNTFTRQRQFGGENAKAGRVSLAFRPDDNFEWDLVVSQLFDRSPQPGSRAVNNYPGYPGSSSSVTQPSSITCLIKVDCGPTAYGTSAIGFTDRGRGDTLEIASNMSYHFEPVTLTSVTGLIKYQSANNQDVDGLPEAILDAYGNPYLYDQESEEFRISSNKGGGWDLDGKLDWVLGGYYSNFRYSSAQDLGIFQFAMPGVANVYTHQDGLTESEAAFAHAIYHITDELSGTFGMRYSRDHKDHDYISHAGGPTNYDTPITFYSRTFEAGISYQFDPDHLVYFRFAQGYEAGGFVGYPACDGCGSSFRPETNNAYEVGTKNDWFEHRLRTNIALFRNELSDLQVESALPIPQPPGFQQLTTNAGSATVQGAEFEITGYPTPELGTHLNVGYLQPKYNQFIGTACSNVAGKPRDCSGIPFALAPKWTVDLGADYTLDLPDDLGSATLSADWSYKSSLYVSDPPYPSSFQNGYGLVNASLKFVDASRKYSVEFYGTNILNRRYKAEFSDPGGLAMFALDGRPAEWGMRITAKFGPFGEEAAPAPAAYVPPPAQAPAPAPRSYLVFFDFNKSDLTPQAVGIVDEAAKNAGPAKVTQITVTGHTDTVGSDAYNMRLSRRRAESVAAQLEKDGIPSSEIEIVAKGKRDLLVPTADGVKEPQNRRVQIVYDNGAAS